MITWQNPGRSLILASKSPRRSQILSTMGFSFTTTSPENIDESSYIDQSNLVPSLERLAIAKARVTAEKEQDSLVLGADTVVIAKGIVLGKPLNRDNAIAMLRQLSSTTHTVITAVALLCAQRSFCQSTTEITTVSFRKISDDDINVYLDFNEYADKAGAYAIQGKAMVFIEKINGCYYNVVGLPVNKTIALFQKFIDMVGANNVSNK